MVQNIHPIEGKPKSCNSSSPKTITGLHSCNCYACRSSFTVYTTHAFLVREYHDWTNCQDFICNGACGSCDEFGWQKTPIINESPPNLGIWTHHSVINCENVIFIFQTLHLSINLLYCSTCIVSTSKVHHDRGDSCIRKILLDLITLNGVSYIKNTFFDDSAFR